MESDTARLIDPIQNILSHLDRRSPSEAQVLCPQYPQETPLLKMRVSQQLLS